MCVMQIRLNDGNNDNRILLVVRGLASQNKQIVAQLCNCVRHKMIFFKTRLRFFHNKRESARVDLTLSQVSLPMVISRMHQTIYWYYLTLLLGGMLHFLQMIYPIILNNILVHSCIRFMTIGSLHRDSVIEAYRKLVVHEGHIVRQTVQSTTFRWVIYSGLLDYELVLETARYKNKK